MEQSETQKVNKELIIELLKLLDQLVDNSDSQINRHSVGLKKALIKKYTIKELTEYKL